MVFMLYICNTTKTINLIMKQDVQIFDLIRSERDRQSSGLELIASENYVSDYVLEAMGSICTNKYAEAPPIMSFGLHSRAICSILS